MSSPESEPMKVPTAPPDEPPSYNTIAPCAPAITHPLIAPNPTLQNMEMKGVPPGLQYLLEISQFSVMEKYSVGQSVWGRHFEVMDPMGQRIYQASEEVQCCQGIYNLKIRDNAGEVVMAVTESCGCRCNRQMEMSTANSEPLGSATLKAFSSITEMTLMSSSMEPLLLILGPSFQSSMFGNVNFEVKSRDGQHAVGWIKCENNQFVASFPLDLEVSVKSLLLGSCFYLDSLLCSARKRVARRRD